MEGAHIEKACGLCLMDGAETCESDSKSGSNLVSKRSSNKISVYFHNRLGAF